MCVCPGGRMIFGDGVDKEREADVKTRMQKRKKISINRDRDYGILE